MPVVDEKEKNKKAMIENFFVGVGDVKKEEEKVVEVVEEGRIDEMLEE